MDVNCMCSKVFFRFYRLISSDSKKRVIIYVWKTNTPKISEGCTQLSSCAIAAQGLHTSAVSTYWSLHHQFMEFIPPHILHQNKLWANKSIGNPCTLSWYLTGCCAASPQCKKIYIELLATARDQWCSSLAGLISSTCCMFHAFMFSSSLPFNHRKPTLPCCLVMQRDQQIVTGEDPCDMTTAHRTRPGSHLAKWQGCIDVTSTSKHMAFLTTRDKQRAVKCQ